MLSVTLLLTPIVCSSYYVTIIISCYKFCIDGTASSVGPQECFNFNTDGTVFGNCGHNSSAFLACATECVDSIVSIT